MASSLGGARLRRVLPVVFLIAFLYATIGSGSALAATDSCGYPDATNGTLSQTAFNESEVLRAQSSTGSAETTRVIAWYSDEHALTLGAGANVSQMTQHPTDHVSSPNIGDPSAVDLSNRPLYPALFVTDITNDPSSRSGDWQQGGTAAVPPDDVFGTWKTSNAADPAGNTSFGTGADTPPSGITYEGFRAEVRWNVGSFGSPGHSYRVQFMVHDGDQNKAGGDAGEACTNFSIPKATPAIATSATKYALDNQTISDTAHVSGGFSPTGTVDFRVYPDSSCSGLGTLVGTGTLDANGDTSSGPYSPPGPGHYYWRAFYNGDASNNTTNGPCQAANEDSLVATPHLTIVKEVSKDNGVTWLKSVTVYPNTVVMYRFTVTNDGDAGTTLTGVHVNELTGISDCNVQASGGFTGTLAPGASATFTCTHTATASLTNTANASGTFTPPGGTATSVSSANDDAHVVVINPAFSILKTVSPTGAVHVGDPLTYTITVSNTGDADLSFSLSDLEQGTSTAGCTFPAGTSMNFTIAKGAPDKVLTCTKSAPDQDSYTNEACATSTDGLGGQITHCSHVTTTIEKPAFTIDKAVSPSGAVHVGDNLHYTITVTNTGNTDLTFSLKDIVFASSPEAAGCDQYAPGTPATFTLPHGSTGNVKVLTCDKAAPNQSSYDNQACATGTDSIGGPNGVVSHCDDVTTQIKHPGFQVTKTVDKATAKVGDTLTYTITARNTGDDVLHVTNFDDHIKGTGVAGCDFAAGAAPPSSFDLQPAGDPSGGDVRTFTCTHVVAASDPVPYTNVACFDASDGLTATPATFSQCPEATTTANDAVLTITKTVDKATAVDNETLGYTIVVKNVGRAVADDVQVSDLIAGTTHGCGTLSGPAQGGSLAPGASLTYTCSYPVAHADEDSSHHIVNTATVTGKNPDGSAVPPQSSSATTLIQHPAIAIDKTGPATAQSGDKISYTLTVTNPGDVSFDEANVVVSDPQCNGDPVTLLGKGGDQTTATFDPGDVWTYTCSLQTQVSDTGPIHNVATVTGTHAPAPPVQASDSADTTLSAPEQLVLPERVTPGAANLVAPTGCVAKAFNARVRGSKIATVVFVLDGKVVKRVKAKANAKSVQVRIDPRKLRIGVHRLVVNVTFQSGSGTRPKTMRLSFQRCSRRLAKPRFTG